MTTTRPCPHCGKDYDIARRMHGDRVYCLCGSWSAVVMYPDGRTELRPCDAPDGSAPARETTQAAALLAELSAVSAELVTAREDNAMLLNVLREIDFDYDKLSPRAQRLLNRISEAEHPGRALMGELMKRMSALERERDAARAGLKAAKADAAPLRNLHRAIEALPDAIYEPGCDCDYCAGIDAARQALR